MRLEERADVERANQARLLWGNWRLRIRDLSLPVAAVKSNWVPATRSFDFTPKDASTNAQATIQSTVADQAHRAYVIEYIVHNIEKPNPGFETDPDYLKEVEIHSASAGKLTAVHRLRASARPKREIVGEEAYERLQKLWARDGKRYRWAVAFPIVESYDVVDAPDARALFGEDRFRKLFAHPAGALRPLDGFERDALSELAIKPRVAINAWIGIEDEAEMAMRSQVSRKILREIGGDLADGALEGLTQERQQKVRMRAAWLAQKFVIRRQQVQKLFCDDCGFDPATKVDGTSVKARSLIDVHHKDPLAEGHRYTTMADFSLLCPTCHRFVHALQRSGKNGLDGGVN